ncbi:hypothetical protein [Pseudomonas sp. Irchel 3E13]|uniref:hypothetical protein n=1 Tax=Pseudomonas sp. Irchel 3E13 TaxID=2008975 RepID=UPI000BA2D2D1|nr:hypothetical protein [Pseudomonas sp. Irchel 3E13]
MRFAVLLMLLSMSVTASDPVSLEAGIADAVSQGDLDAAGVALAELKQMACSGNPIAAAKVGRFYLLGNGLFERDVEKAKPFLRFGAESGAPSSAADLAVAIATNPASVEALEEAAKWAKVAQYVDGEGNADVVAQLVRLAAAGSDLTEGIQDGARWIQLYRTRGTAFEGSPCQPG